MMVEGDKQGAAAEDWFGAKRPKVEGLFIDERLVAGSEEVRCSSSGKYQLVIQDYATREGSWCCTRGLVYAGDRLIADVRRNYGIFHAGWAEGHPDGHDYLLCGEDYQGQTVIQLDTGRRVDYLPPEAKGGTAFCCAAYYPSPDRKLIVIDGCYWAGPYELVFCRFDTPMSLPWPELHRAIQHGEPDGWTNDGFVYESAEDIRVTNGKAWHELTDAENEELRERWDEIGGQRIRRWLYTSDGRQTLLGERVERSAP